MIGSRARRAALLALAIAVALAGCARTERAGAGGAGFDSLAAMDPFLAYRRALALGEQQRFAESLPYFRRALAVPTDAWQPHADHAITLFHAALESRPARGFPRPVVRSSRERALWLREAERELDQAERLASTPESKAYVVGLRARQLAVWQLTWDAYAEYSRVAAIDRDYARAAANLLRSLRDPAGTAPPEMP